MLIVRKRFDLSVQTKYEDEILRILTKYDVRYMFMRHHEVKYEDFVGVTTRFDDCKIDPDKFEALVEELKQLSDRIVVSITY